MSHEIELLLARAKTAVASQSWTEAWTLLEQANPDYRTDDRHLGSLSGDFQLLAATCMRHRGQMQQAEAVYSKALRAMSMKDERLPEAVVGLADVRHALGDTGTALQLVRMLDVVPIKRTVVALRANTMIGHVLSHVSVDAACERFDWIFEQFEETPGPDWASLLFHHGDALLVRGEFEKSVERLIAANRMAIEHDASITAADSLRRLPLARILCGQDDFALKAVGDLSQAEQLYKLSGDRGHHYLHTEMGEVYRAIARPREAERCFRKGLWGAQSVNDPNREGHNLLGLHENSRLAGRADVQLLHDAEVCYERAQSDWGAIHCKLAFAISDLHNRDMYLRDARELIGASAFSAFDREMQLIHRIATSPDKDVQAELHLMNYP